MAISNSKDKAKLLAGAAIMALACAPLGSAMAQDAEDGDVIVVTGIKKSIQDSLTAKKESTSVVEAISAEDIGKLPDASIADSLARLPGLTAQRTRGRAQQISIRGLGPDYSIALLNGREQVSAGDNRGIEFDQYPSELIASGLVYKTPDASLAAVGLAGTVDLKTIRPLDYKERTVVAGASYFTNSNGALVAGSKDDGYRFFGSYIDRNEEGTVGWVLSLTTQQNPNQNYIWEVDGYETTPTGEFYPNFVKSRNESREFTRDSVVGTLQWEPQDGYSITLDGFYSNFEDAGTLVGTETPLASWSGAQVDTFVPNGDFVSAIQYSAVVPIVRNEVRGRKAELYSLGGNMKFPITERLKGEIDISRSYADRDDVDLETYAGTGPGRSGAQDVWGLGIDISGGQYFLDTQIDYSDRGQIVLTDPGGWGQVGFIKEPKTRDELDAVRLSANYEVDSSFISSIDVGVNISSRKKAKDSIENFVDFATGGTTELAIPDSVYLGTSNLDHVGLQLVTYDAMALIDNGTYALRPNTNADVITKAWTVDEDVNTWYAKANIDTEFQGIPVRGNFGFQYIETDQSSTGASFIGGANPIQFTSGDSYTNFLPSLNLNFEIQPDTFIRVGVAQTLARARMDQLRASQTGGLSLNVCPDVNADGIPEFNAAALDLSLDDFDGYETCVGVSGGNPQLRPYEATSYDISFEKYFGSLGAISVAAYYKDINQWIADQSNLIDISNAIESLYGAAFLTANPDSAIATNSGPDNTKGGFIQGIEVTAKIPLDNWLPPSLEGFGVNLSYGYTDSEIKPFRDDPSAAVEVPGLSKDVINAEFYYENHGFQARLNGRNRSTYLAEIPGFGANLVQREAIEETVWDAQIGYEFDQGALDGLTVRLQGYNLTDEAFGTRFTLGDLSAPRDLQRYGTQYILSANYKF